VSRESDIASLRDAYEQWARGDFTSPEMFTADAEFVVAGPEPRTYAVPIDAEAANTVVMRDGKIARFEMFWDRDAARKAAGLG
jgi:ketosteroid isomerase-like protein